MNYIPYVVANFRVNELMFMVGYGTLVWWCLYYYTITLLFYWVIPSRVAMFLLAAAFDFMPHYPHHITRKEDKYKTTSFITTTWYLKPILSLLIFYQNYHIAHHLNPVVPFYMYSTIWDQMKEKVLSQHEIEILKILPVLN
jgi:fatty acid desaturase